MDIKIVAAIGRGKTLLSSFDNALQGCGVCNYNLIPLSSVIPPQTTIITDQAYTTPDEHFGHKLYVVKAEERSDHAGKAVGAAIGWIQRPDGRGLFVEHEFVGESEHIVEETLRSLVTNSLKDLCTFRKFDINESDIHMKLITAPVTDQPTCALVLATYKAEGWN